MGSFWPSLGLDPTKRCRGMAPIKAGYVFLAWSKAPKAQRFVAVVCRWTGRSHDMQQLVLTDFVEKLGGRHFQCIRLTAERNNLLLRNALWR